MRDSRMTCFGFLFVAQLIAAFGAPMWGRGAGYVEVPIRDMSFRIDGLVTPRERAMCEVTTLTRLGSYEKPRCETHVYLAATDQGLYLGFVCDDPNPGNLVTSVTQQSAAVIKDDSVEFVLCPAPVAERDNYFHFAINAAGFGYSWDMQFDRPVPEWLSEAAVTPIGWEAECFIPFSAIRGRLDVAQWRGNFQRNRPARLGEQGETSVWFDPGLTIHNYRKFGFLRFVTPRGQDAGDLLEALQELRRLKEGESTLSPVPESGAAPSDEGTTPTR